MKYTPLMTLTAEQLTLLAAIIAAVASVITLLMNIFAARSAEMRVAHRQSLEKFIHKLSSAIHATIATANILTKAKTEPAIKNWRDKATEAQNNLKELRLILRYPLWGITDAMNTLTRLPNWIEGAIRFPNNAKLIFIKGKRLGIEIDISIRNSYTHGRPPTLYERFRVWIAERQLENIHERTKKPLIKH